MKDYTDQIGSEWGVIMAGGIGTRLWPESTKEYPKQFRTLIGKKSLAKQCFERIVPLFDEDHVLLVGAKSNRKLIKYLFSSVHARQPENFLFEPSPRNTAACIAYAASVLFERDPNAIMAVFPSDHYISDNRLFQKTILTGLQLVQNHPDCIITIGIEPDEPQTGFGYIEKGASFTRMIPLEVRDRIRCFKVERFKEKPSLQTAREYLKTYNYLWNSGIFIWRADHILKLLRAADPAWDVFLERIKNPQTIEQAYEEIRSISIDYAIMENAKDVFVLSAPFCWDDLGSFHSLARMDEDLKDQDDNLARGCNLITFDARNNQVRTSGRRNANVVLIGVNDLIVVQARNNLLIVPKERENEIKNIFK
ncbi:MAG: mannose-1-phosphate guanylyltransferase [Planctomycetia bacterium]|nr:mannose-1-phosphate guanylyltransferase [Planctomycetia bacterium]